MLRLTCALFVAFSTWIDLLFVSVSFVDVYVSHRTPIRDSDTTLLSEAEEANSVEELSTEELVYCKL